ncbi:HDOD domain-containing protein [Ideonella sp. YS5]|uniref:HDOD domain-containing protein n=1 Tax=Ideonella sp. YS5 TaxID=3453714 RepID=UPI003EECB8BB
MNIELKLPAHPRTLIELSGLMNKPDVNLVEVSNLIETDLSLAAAVMQAVNAPIYGLKGRVPSVQQAVTFLGLREISAIVCETALRAAFPQVPELLAVWERARLRGLLMGRIAQALSMEAWGPHTAGLFEECGKAVLYAYAPEAYADMLKANASSDVALVEAERRTWGIDHAEIGARLCEQWGLPAATVNCVRHHVAVQGTWRLPPTSHRYVCVLSALAHTLVHAPTRLDEAVGKIAPQAMMDQGSLMRAMQRVKDKIDEAMA